MYSGSGNKFLISKAYKDKSVKYKEYNLWNFHT